MSLFDSKNVRIIEVQEEKSFSNNEDVNLQNLPEVKTEESIAEKKEVFPIQPEKKKPKYAWAFFLASMFTGIALSEAFHADSFVLLGMGAGFLFFVDPIYQKVMSKIEKW